LQRSQAGRRRGTIRVGLSRPYSWGILGAGTRPTRGGVWGLVRQGNPWGERGDIGAVAAAWPELPEAIKAGILAMVRAASGEEISEG